MLQRVITRLTVQVHKSPRGFHVQETRWITESTLAGGKMVKEVSRYEDLSDGEMAQVIEDITTASRPGTDLEVGATLFAL